MTKKTVDDIGQPPDETPGDYSDVLAQSPDMHPELKSHVVRLATEAGETALIDDAATTGGQLPIIDDTQTDEEEDFDSLVIPKEDVQSEIGETALDSSKDKDAPTGEPQKNEVLTKAEREKAAEKWVSEHIVTEKVPEEDYLFGDDETKTILKFHEGEVVPPEYGSEVVAKLLARDDYDVMRQLVVNLGRFSALDESAAEYFLKDYPREVLENISSFAGLSFDRQLADTLIRSRNGGLVVDHIKDFNDFELDSTFAYRLIDTGNAYAVIDNADSFEGVKLDAAFIDRALKNPSNASDIAASIDEFPEVDADDKLAQRILDLDGVFALRLYIENFHDLSNTTAERLLTQSKGYERASVYEHIEVFPSLTAEVLIRIIDSLPPDDKTYGLDNLPSEMQTGLCSLMIDRDGYDGHILRRFSSLDGSIAQNLIDQGHLADVLESVERFTDFDLDLDFAKRFLAGIEGYPGPLIHKIEKFPKELHSSIAQLIIDRGYADQLDYLIERGSIVVNEVLTKKIASLSVAMGSNPPDDGVGSYLNAFPDTDHHILAERLTRIANSENVNYQSYDLERISAGLKSLKGLDNSIAEKIISNGGSEVLASHLESFSHLDSSIAEHLIDEGYIVTIFLNQNVFNDFVMTAGQALELIPKDRTLWENRYSLKRALEYMQPNKPPVFDNELAHRMIDGSDIYAFSELFELFDGLDGNIAKSLIENGQAGIVFDNIQQFDELDQLNLAKIAITNYGYHEVFNRLSQFEGLEDVDAEGEESVIKFVELIRDKELITLLNEDGALNGLSAQFLNLYMRSDKHKKLLDLARDKELVDLIGSDGPLQILSVQFLNLYINSDNPEALKKQLKALAGGNTALWRVNHEYAKLLIGEVGDVGYLHDYKVSAIPLALPRRDVDTLFSQIPKPIPFAELDEDARRMVLSREYLEQHTDVMTESEISFTDLNSDSQDALLAYRLYEAIAHSRDSEEQIEASERNKVFAEAGNYWNLGDLVHATGSVGSLRSIMLNGVLCGETIGASTASDSYPFNVDTVVISEEVLTGENHRARLDKLKNSTFGGIVLLFHRTPDSTDYGRETNGGMNDDHRLVFGAMPSTEISAILLRGSDLVQRDLVVDTVIESGIYVPVVDEEGSLLLGYEEYQSRRADGNYVSVQPRIIDSSFQREGTQLGSNEGAMFVIPEETGPSRYYVKFGDVSSEKRDHLWTEILADRIYRAVTPHLVPETDAVIVEGRLAKVSKIVEADETQAVTDEARNAGFVMDAFLGNWDAVFNSANLVMTSDGRAMRIDTGNGLDFRARGGRKEEGSFGEIVQEIETGTDNNNLGGGMRQMYPGLTDDDIKSQVAELRDRLPDEMIDAIVESIRRPKSEREELARILKARKQYLIEKFL